MSLLSKAGILRPGVVSVVLVNHDGADHTMEALRAVDELDWPEGQLEVVVVDTASAGDDVTRIRDAAPHATVVALDENAGFAGGCNRGVDVATGEWIAFLNNDARPARDWLQEGIPVLRNDGVACVASK
ncbi:MAG TPA: glycosyltransferase, partial [Acidimicrobiales bacterium]